MIAILLMLAMLAAPFGLWAAGWESAALFAGIYVLLCVPAMVLVTYHAVKSRTWPKLVGGPSISFGRKKIGF